jgi:hypothetical protein
MNLIFNIKGIDLNFYSAKISVFHLTCKLRFLTIGIILTIKASLIHLIFTFIDYQLNSIIQRLKISFQH